MARKKLYPEQILMRIKCKDEGLSIKESASRCGCKESTYSVWSSTHGNDEVYKDFYRNLDIPTRKSSKLTNNDLKYYKHLTHKPLNGKINSDITIIVDHDLVNKTLNKWGVKQIVRDETYITATQATYASSVKKLVPHG